MSGLERVKFFARVDPEDAQRFRAAREALTLSERRRVTDAEVFRRAIRELVASLSPSIRRQLTSREAQRGKTT